MEPKYKVGDSVRIRNTNQIGNITKVSKSSKGFAYYVMVGEKKKRYREEDLSLYIDIEDSIFSDFETGIFGNADQFRQYVYYRQFSEAQEKNLYSHQGNKIIFNPFQYKPLLKFLGTDSDERLLIADEVGVGKTIETGIILDELLARGDLKDRDSILVVCPNILCRKWQDELREKFQMDDFQILDSKTLQFLLSRIKDGSRSSVLHGIVSEQLIRAERFQIMLSECRDTLGEPFIQFLVIDECHHYRNHETNTHKMGALLSRCSERVVMLSATPFNLQSSDLYYQLHMLNPALFPEESIFDELKGQIRKVNKCIYMLHKGEGMQDGSLLKYVDDLYPLANHNEMILNGLGALRHQLTNGIKITPGDVAKYENILNMLNPLASSFTRTLKRDAIEHRVTRDVRTAEVHFTDAEAKIYEDFVDISLLRHELNGVSEKAFGLISNGLERIAASSIVALERNIRYFMDEGNREEDESLENNLDIDESSSSIMRTILYEKYSGLLQQIKDLDGKDSKYDALKYLIDNIRCNSPDNRRIIIFSFYVGTLKYLRKRLKQEGYSVALMYGGTPLETPKRRTVDEDGFLIRGRTELIRAFKDGEFDILLASEVGGEGLDFQFCTALINYDLPYNPMRIEQRIGRIDRMGQLSDKIIIGNLCIENTIDMVINRVLLSRISDATDLVGDLEPIITQQMEEINQMMLRKELTPEELIKREKEIAARIEKERLTREEFDKQRFELVNDAGFRGEFENAIRNSRINPRDSMLFTASFLKGINGCWSKSINNTSMQIHLTKDMKDRIAKYEKSMESITGGKELREIIHATGDPSICFEGDEAYNNPDYIFVKPSGAWIHFMIEYLRNNDTEEKRRLFHASVKKNYVKGLDAGKYLIFIYDYEFVGFRETITTSYVVVNGSGNSPVFINEKQWENIVQNMYGERNHVDIPIEEVEDARCVADETSDEELEKMHREMTEKNDIKIVARMKAIQSLSDSHIKEQMAKLQSADDSSRERILRDIEKERTKTKEKLRGLEKRRNLTSSSSLQALCVLNVV